MGKIVLITGATGVMGSASLRELLLRGSADKIRLLVRDSKKNRRFLRKYTGNPRVEIIRGDLLDAESVKRAVDGSDIILHMGGMVSPLADRYPDHTLRVNVEGTRNIVEAALAVPADRQPALVYVGSVAQTSNRMPPNHWARIGDPIDVAKFDAYGLSKARAERIVAESGLRRWVSLRQSGILHAGLLTKTDDPIMFHVPLKGVLEWTTLEDSGRLMAAVCEDNVPERFWKNFYNVGSGSEYRLTNYEFEQRILKAAGCPPPEKIFETDWFATRNFHGAWFVDSDELDHLVPFRLNIPIDEYFRRMIREAPWWIKLAPLAPASVVKGMMRKVAHTPGLGTLHWIEREDMEEYVEAFFGSREERENIPGWNDFDLSRPSENAIRLNHGYNESKPEESLSIEDMREAAAFRGGACLSADMTPGDMDTALEWECSRGHRFAATPRLILRGGHWCPDCLTL